MTSRGFLSVLRFVYSDRQWPKPLHVLQGLHLIERGASLQEARSAVNTTVRALSAARESLDPVAHVLGMRTSDLSEERVARAASMLGQLLLGRCAETAFEEIYRTEMGSEELELRDLRESRTDTDYRLLNGQGRPVYRINIKFHGSRFRRATELVGLDPEDTFALATYKIHGAMGKQQEEGLPYVFAVVGVPRLSGELVGEQLPKDIVAAAAFIHEAPKGQHKRDFEDAAVDSLIAGGHAAFQSTLEEIRRADWYILSARRADKLLRELLFDRVFALRIRSFARVFRGAELDMHFSLSGDLTPLKTFLSVLQKEGMHKTTTLLERGDY